MNGAKLRRVENNPNSNLSERCCDFKLLEAKCREYNQVKLKRKSSDGNKF